MKREHDIKWFLQDPTRLLQMKPFTRGGQMLGHPWEKATLLNNTTLDTGFCNLQLQPISQDVYITEYRPDLHIIKLNQSIPHIQVRIDGRDMPFGIMDMTQTASFQKIIHSAHVRSLTANPLEFTLGRQDAANGGLDVFENIKDEWSARDMDWWLASAINICKQLGNCGLLFRWNVDEQRVEVNTFSYEDGYQIIPNYDEFGYEVARSLTYKDEESLIIETFDGTNHYHIVQGGENGWTIDFQKHGFSRCPLLYKRGKVAWEYAESSIEMWELMTNIKAIALKRFGTFALAFWGEMDGETFKRDASTLVVNLASDTSQGKQDVKVLDYPEPKTLDSYLEDLKVDISLFSSTSFITPKDITTTNSGGNGIALAMSNDYALATQAALDWRKFVNDMLFLFREGLDIEDNQNRTNLRMSAKIVPWSLETNNTKITNLQMEAKWLSMQTILEKSPDAAPDEAERIIKERGALVPMDASQIESDAEKAARVSINRSNVIRDNV